MMTKKKNLQKIKSQKKKQKQRTNKNIKLIIKKKSTKKKHVGGSNYLGAAAGLLGAAGVAKAAGVDVGSVIDNTVSNVVSPVKKGLQNTGQVAKELGSGFLKTITGVKDKVREEFNEMTNKIKNNTSISGYSRSLINACKEYQSDPTTINNLNNVIDQYKSNLKDCFVSSYPNDSKYPVLFKILDILGKNSKNDDILKKILKQANLRDNEIMTIINKEDTNCLHYCSLKGLLPALKVILNNFINEEGTYLFIFNKKSLNPLHYALKSNSKNGPNTVRFLIDNDNLNNFKNNDIDPDKVYTSFLLKQKNKKYSLMREMMEILIDNDFHIPLGKDFVETNSTRILNDMKKYIEEQGLKYSIQLSHLNDLSINSYHCPQQELDLGQMNNEEEGEFNSDISDSESDNLDEEGRVTKKINQDAKIYEKYEDAQQENDTDIITQDIKSGAYVQILDNQGECFKIKFGPTTGWVKKSKFETN